MTTGTYKQIHSLGVQLPLQSVPAMQHSCVYETPELIITMETLSLIVTILDQMVHHLAFTMAYKRQPV